MNQASFDKSEPLQIKARVNEEGNPITIKFLNVDTSKFDITAKNFIIDVWDRPGGKVLFSLGIGTGLVVNDINELIVSLSKLNATKRIGEYFYQLRSLTEDKTWLTGPWVFHNKENTNGNNTSEVTINLETTITLIISGGSSSVNSILWILYSGYWNDGGLWFDDQNWND